VKKLKSSSIAVPSPQRGEGLGVRGIAILPQRTFVFPHLERFFSLSWNSMRHALRPSPLTPLPRWGEGNRDRLIISHLQGVGWVVPNRLDPPLKAEAFSPPKRGFGWSYQ